MNNTMNVKNIILSSGIASRMSNETFAEYVRESLGKFRAGNFGDFFKVPEVRGGIVSTTYKKEGTPYVCVSLDTGTGETYVSTIGSGEVRHPNASIAMVAAVEKQVKHLSHIIHAWDEWMEWFSGNTIGPEPTSFPAGYRYPEGIWDYMGDWNAPCLTSALAALAWLPLRGGRRGPSLSTNISLASGVNWTLCKGVKT